MTYTDFFIMGLVDFFGWARWLIAAAFVLTMADLKFGIAAARFRREVIKRSRAVRRTIDKVCSYVLWIVIAYSFGQAFGKPFGVDLLPVAILLVIYGVELESIYTNHFAAHGRKLKVNIFKYFGKRADIIEVGEQTPRNEPAARDDHAEENEGGEENV